MNIEINVHMMEKLKSDLKLNSSILRFLFIKKKKAIKHSSIILNNINK